MSQASPIRVLSQPVVARIAAGEVITRPRAVVKELIDNALDAGAHEIHIEVSGGGYFQVEVHDDGVGIPSADAPLVLTRHATSKLDDSGDLTGIHTLGFRGEALASIAAVGDIEIRSCYAGESVGTRISSRTGASEYAPLIRQRGTSIVATRA